PPNQTLERRAVEERHHGSVVAQLPVPLVPPVVGIVDRDVPVLEVPEAEAPAFDEDVVGGADADREDRGQSIAENAEAVVLEVDGGEEQERADQGEDPAGEQEEYLGRKVVAVLAGEPALELFTLAQVIELGVALDGARDLEARRTEEPDV